MEQLLVFLVGAGTGTLVTWTGFAVQGLFLPRAERERQRTPPAKQYVVYVLFAIALGYLAVVSAEAEGFIPR